MSVFKNSFSRALVVIPSDDVDIPYPNVIIRSTNTSTATNALRDSTVNFITSNVSVGDTIYNTSTNTAATVISVDSAVKLTISDDIFTSSPNTYVIYGNGNGTRSGNTGCSVYVGGTGDMQVTTIGGDVVIFVQVPAGILPVQVTRVWSTNTRADAIVALW